MADLVTIQRVHLESLLHSSQLVQDELSSGTPPSHVLLEQVRLEALQAVARRYENLRNNLLRGGVSEGTVDLLSQDDATIQQAHPISPPEPTSAVGVHSYDTNLPGSRVTFDATNFSLSQHADNRYGEGGSVYNYEDSNHGHGAWANADDEEDLDIGRNTPTEDLSSNGAPKPESVRLERQSTRTLQLLNLAEGTNHRDIVKAVRGGMLLDIYIRSNERTASLSFVHAADARVFLDHVRRHDLYIKNKRLDIRWNERQFILPGNIASAISRGASRNLVIRGCDSRHTEESIREDLDHIHNLVVVKIEFKGKDCHLSLNSIHNAVYARTCMMSRFKYKSTRIEWDIDECAQSYEKLLPIKHLREPSVLPKAPITSNRFGLLSVSDDEDDIPATFQSTELGIAA